LPDSVSFAQLDAILYANRKKELTEPQIREGSWRKERRTSYSREFKVRLAARKTRAAPLMQSLYDWIQTQMKTLSRHSDTAKAFSYDELSH
jgi:hypothetical protein